MYHIVLIDMIFIFHILIIMTETSVMVPSLVKLVDTYLIVLDY